MTRAPHAAAISRVSSVEPESITTTSSIRHSRFVTIQSRSIHSMRILIVRLSAMGDLVQTLPALTDAARAIPDIKFDWVVDESFADVPVWHSHVENVFPTALRRW